MPRSQLYDSDFYAWANEQAALLRAGKLSAADIENIAEEIESMGKTEKREFVSRLRVLLLHLLKWRFQPEGRSASWEASLRIQRLELEDHLADNPSLKAKLPEALEMAYERARIEASLETKLPIAKLPNAAPWSFEQMMDSDFWPEDPGN